ncbi:hypothetical protein [Streptomyces sp. 7-21]|uniref:hypothetical protein n=1 Tax=Streptomyces sp. 7-21 TaxID=2802283 RepID=UPI00191E3AB4|nr:hypothetical protein [Streptomyces sp. 7-21]MBL1066081.1 hypothetical protein [Streptomyces sp. 7-21]
MYRSPTGPAGRGPQRSWRATDFDNWSRAVCGRVLPPHQRGSGSTESGPGGGPESGGGHPPAAPPPGTPDA